MRKTNESRLSALALSAVLAVLIVPIASKSPKADPSVSHPPALASLTGDERFQPLDPTSRGYMQPSGSRAGTRRYEEPISIQTAPKRQRKPETN
jgi:hypothetical protein